MTSDENLDWHKKIKSTRNGKFVGKHKQIDFFLLISLKDQDRLTQKYHCKMEFAVYTEVTYDTTTAQSG